MRMKRFVKGNESLRDLHNEFLTSLVIYIQEQKLTLCDISQKTTLSTSTLRRFLKNHRMRDKSYRKLLKLGDTYINNVQTNLMESLAEMESKAKTRSMRRSLHFYGDYFIEFL